MRVQIVPAEDWHVEAIAADAREADVRELWEGCRTSPKWAMRRGMASTREPLTGLVDGVPVAMFGCSPYSLLGGIGVPWMVGSNGLKSWQAQKALLRQARVVVEAWREMFPALMFNAVDVRNTSAIRWLGWLGFEMGDIVPYGPDGIPFQVFLMRGNP